MFLILFELQTRILTFPLAVGCFFYFVDLIWTQFIASILLQEDKAQVLKDFKLQFI